MRRLCVALVALACVLVLPPAGQAERAAGTPKKLWSEYPLVPKGRQAAAAPRPAEPFLPPVQAETPVRDGQHGWILWLAVAAAGTFLLLAATSRLATSRGRVGGRSVQAALSARTRHFRPRAQRAGPTLRMPSRLRRRAGSRAHGRPAVVQYAPLSVVPPPSVVAEPAPRESVPYVTRRSGLLRSRYVVMMEESGRAREVRRSRAFWLLGREAWQSRMAEDAWDELANELRAEGWEVDVTGRYEYFIPLRRAIVSTLEPYTRWERESRPQS